MTEENLTPYWRQLAKLCKSLRRLSGSPDLEKVDENKIEQISYLLEVLKPMRPGSIIEEEAESILHEYNGDYAMAAEFRARELELILKLYRSFVEHKDQSGNLWILAYLGPNSISLKYKKLTYLIKRSFEVAEDQQQNTEV